MFIDKLNLILLALCFFLWVVANLIVVFHYSLNTMVEFFWTNQRVMGKIGSNIFYSLAWVLKALQIAVVCVLYFICTPIYKFFKWFVVQTLHPLYDRIKKLEL